jgi:hypothetical protein
MLGTMAILMSLAAAPAPAEELGWLSGAWVSETTQGWTEENWTSPRGGMLLGTNRSGEGAKATGYEFMRIACEEERCTFYGSPAGQPPVAFRETSRLDVPHKAFHEMVFENTTHDYPTKIVYRREGDILSGTVSGPGGKNPMSWTFRRPAERYQAGR